MTAPDVFEYALVRVVPRVERGEAINVGVIVYSQTFRYLCARIELDEPRLLAVDPAADLDAVRAGLSAFEKACTEGPLAGRPLGERFRWLAAPRSTIVQPGPVHSGLTADPAAELTHLFDTLVRVSPDRQPRALGSTAVTENLDPVAHNRAAWDREVDRGNEWTRPVGPDVIARARTGDWSVVLIGYEPVPRDWFPADITGTVVLCLASGGGQQGPVLAAAGADVTVFDNSPRQLARDEQVAARDGLAIRTVPGDMRDLSAFADGSFDLVFNPVSNVFSPDLAPVWRECFRVLRPAGLLLTGFLNPDLYIFDAEALETRAEFVVRYRVPFSTLDLPEAERRRVYGDGPIEYSHTLTGQIGGQLAAGFVLTHLVEAPHQADATARYMPGYFATRAVKPPSVKPPVA